jgi:starch phosphorylase
MKAEPTFRIHPRTFFFGAKSAPSYSFAKNVIELINCVSDVINNDPEISKYMKIVFIENYGVSAAEVIIPGSDVSEQISTAGKEASGTSNMKFMINGAITLGTLDGANVEINALVGDDHSVIFGLKDYELDEIRRNHSYKSWDVYNNNYWVRQVIDSLVDGSWHWDRNAFRQIFDEIMWGNDEYFNLLDFDSYVAATLRTDHMYKNKLEWAKSCLINIAKSGYFSSDRTIEQYVEDIWHLNKIEF